jgi:hypothetical protein
MQIIVIPNQMIVGFALPERNDFLREELVNFVSREGFPAMQNFAQRVRRLWPNHNVDVIWHDYPGSKFVPLVVKES